MNARIRVLIAHGEPLVRAGLQLAIQACSDLEIRAICDGSLADCAGLDSIDVVLTDCDCGMKLAQRSRTSKPRILIVTNDASESSIRGAMDAGAKGYLLLGSTLESVAQAVRCVVRGGVAIDPVAATRMLESLNGESLTQRELQVVCLLMQGSSNKTIARELGISEGTAKTHLKSIMSKLNARSRTQAVTVAQRRGIVPREIVSAQQS
jgi:DNA-binding NarL/FixJ family response regulator